LIAIFDEAICLFRLSCFASSSRSQLDNVLSTTIPIYEQQLGLHFFLAEYAPIRKWGIVLIFLHSFCSPSPLFVWFFWQQVFVPSFGFCVYFASFVSTEVSWVSHRQPGIMYFVFCVEWAPYLFALCSSTMIF